MQEVPPPGPGAKILLPGGEPKAYGVAEMDGDRVVKIVEKPKEPKSNWAVIGIYFYDGRVFDIVKKLKPSARGELEITDVNNAYIEMGEMTADVNGFWADAGENIDFYLKACNSRAVGAQQGMGRGRRPFFAYCLPPTTHHANTARHRRPVPLPPTSSACCSAAGPQRA